MAELKWLLEHKSHWILLGTVLLVGLCIVCHDNRFKFRLWWWDLRQPRQHTRPTVVDSDVNPQAELSTAVGVEPNFVEAPPAVPELRAADAVPKQSAARTPTPGGRSKPAHNRCVHRPPTSPSP
jgi:hypothetical protein